MGVGKLKRRRNTPPGYGASQSRARARRGPPEALGLDSMGPIEFPSGRQLLGVVIGLVVFGMALGAGSVWLFR